MNAFHQTATIQAQRLSPIASQQRRDLTGRESWVQSLDALEENHQEETNSEYFTLWLKGAAKV